MGHVDRSGYGSRQVGARWSTIQRGLATATFALALPAALSASTVEQGQKVYGDQKCAMCHSIAGKGNTKGPLDGVGKNLSTEDIRQWIVNAPEMAAKTKATRKPLMKAYSSLSKADVDGLVAYMQTLK